jgi:hypothetical protein
MGNIISEEEDDENRFLDEGFNLESPDADREINYGTSGSTWQNNKEKEPEEGQEVVMQQDQQDQSNLKKMSYIQMAKMGYQELVNAIIRPPRADYKVLCLCVCVCRML